MRIACLYLPSFPLQAYLRQAPARLGAPVAIAGARVGGRAAIVSACSRAAWALGVRPGMSAAAARQVAPELIVVAADDDRERATARAIAETLLADCEVVDPGERVRGGGATGWALYTQVPARSRGSSFGARLIKALEHHGLRGRVGVADDRFTAWVAAAFGGRVREQGHEVAASGPAFERRDRAAQIDLGPSAAPRELPPKSRAARSTDPTARLGIDPAPVTIVPCGGSAAFLAPLPLSLLPIPDEVLGMLTSLAVTTLGEFATLPPPSVSRPWAADVDFQALARGAEGAPLRRFAADGPLVERVELEAAASAGERGHGERIAGALRLAAHRIAQRLAGRGRAATRLGLRVILEDDGGDRAREASGELDVGDVIGHASADEVALLSVLLRAGSPLLPSLGRAAIEVSVLADAEPDEHEDDLFSRAGAVVSTAALDASIARVEAVAAGTSVVRALPVEHAAYRRTAASGSRRRRREARPAQARLFG